jgi:Asp-tRNA(Asn)/Glu-tRNA(Gln) amidotransferase A subunit family amidase
VALVETEQWDACGPDSQRAVWDLARELSDRHAVVEVVGLPAELSGLADQHRVVMAYEAARALAFEHRHHRSRLSAVLCEFLDEGRATDPEAYDLVRHRIGTARQRATGLFADCDVILTPAVVGEAPLGLGSTGDPRFGRMWTMLGLPSVSVPRSLGATGLPVGVQLVGADGADGRLLAVTAWLASTLEQTPG